MSVQKYKMFHGKEPKKISTIKFHYPKQLILLGKCIAVEYKCNKLNGGGNGTNIIFRHEFEKPTILCMDEKSKEQLYIIGKKLKVSKRGIIN